MSNEMDLAEELKDIFAGKIEREDVQLLLAEQQRERAEREQQFVQSKQRLVRYLRLGQAQAALQEAKWCITLKNRLEM